MTFPEPVHFTDWTEFNSKLSNIDPNLIEEEFCKELGFDPMLYSKMLDHAVWKWRVSPTQSMFRAIDGMNVARTGKKIFASILEQTRFIHMAQDAFGRNIISGMIAYHNGKPFRVRDANALTADEQPVNMILQMIYAYYYRNSQKAIKLPKVLYRGFRFNDIMSIPEISNLLKNLDYGDKSPEERHKHNVDIVIDYILEKGLPLETRIVSSSSSNSVANYFANGAGMVIRFDPKRVRILTSEQHEDRLRGASPATMGKDEKEYVISIPKDYTLTHNDIIIHSLDYFHATNSPLFVGLMNGKYRIAEYEMNGVPITVRCSWRTNTKLVQYFNGDSRSQFKKVHGFDPMPTPANLDQISNFVIKRANNLLTGWRM